MCPLHAPIILLLSIFTLLLASCTNTRSVADLENIQDARGFHTKSLYYAGSSKPFHYFEQFTLLGDGWWVPGFEDDGYRTYRVRRSALSLPKTWEFPHSDYKGPNDARRIKVRIRAMPHPHVQKRI
jgi:hypothetical protein